MFGLSRILNQWSFLNCMLAPSTHPLPTPLHLAQFLGNCRSVLLSWEQFCPHSLFPGNMWLHLETCLVVTARGEGAPGVYRVETRDAGKYPTVVRMAPPQNYLARNAKSAHIKKPCYGGSQRPIFQPHFRHSPKKPKPITSHSPSLSPSSPW